MIKKKIKNVFFSIYSNATEVIVTPRGARFGNILYFFLRAYIYKTQGRKVKILETKHFIDILTNFPSLREFVIKEEKIKFYHNKNNSNEFYQIWGKDFTLENLNMFIDIYLKDEIIKKKGNLLPKENDLTINIRRGDFYEKGNASMYGYDQISFIKHVMQNYTDGNWSTINIVSDDIEWCENNMQFLSQNCKRLIFKKYDNNIIISGFLDIIYSKNLILSNSTFSLWAAYISNYLFNSIETTYCPIFGSRRTESTDLYQYNPQWNMIRDFDFNEI